MTKSMQGTPSREPFYTSRRGWIWIIKQ